MQLVVTILSLWTIIQTFCGRLAAVELFSLSTRTEKSWLGWAWGAESTVSIVDRSPPLSYVSRPAAFGSEISGPILGYVIPLASFTTECPATNVSDSHLYTSLNTGCPKLCVDGPHQPDPSESWIALVQRGKCEFVSKVREAQRLGARAVVVGGQDPEVSGLPDTLVNMYSTEDSSDVKIAATFIKYSDYSQLSSLIASSNTSHSGLATLSLLITADYTAWEWYSPIITFVIILFLPSLLTFITLLVHRIRAARAAQRDRAPEDVVRSLPWLIWNGKGSWEKHEGHPPDLEQALVPELTSEPTSKDEEPEACNPSADSDGNDPLAASTSALPEQHPHPWFESQVDCAICLSEFVKGDKVRILPCNHIFHMEEVDEWLIQRKKLCPVCKSDVTQHDDVEDQPEHSSQSSTTDVEPTESSLPRPFSIPWTFFLHPGAATTQPTSSAPVTEENERTPLLGNGRQSNNYSAPV